MANYTAKIGGSTVNVIAGSLHVENQIGQRSTGGMSVWGSLGTTWLYGTSVQVYDDLGALAFSGYVSKDKAKRATGAKQGVGYLEHDIQLMDNCYRADKRVIFASYLNTPAGTIVSDILGRVLTAEGVTTLPGSIAAGATITEVIWNGKQVSEALTWLATQSGYWWNIDSNGVLWFQPYTGGLVAPFILDGTQADSMKDLTVEFGNDMYVNRQYAKGAYAEKGTTASPLVETFVLGSATSAVTLSYQVSTIISVTLNGVNITSQIGTKGSTGNPFYYATGDAVIAQDPSQVATNSGKTLVVTYKGRYPVLALAQNGALVTAQKSREGGGSGYVESVYVNTKVRTLPAAFQIAGALLSHYGADTTVLSFATRSKGLLPGQMMTVNLSDFGLTGRQMLISNVAISDQVDGLNIWYVVQAVGSPVDTAQWQTYWQNLMNQNADPSDLADVSDTSLASLFSSVVTTTWTGTITATKTTCLICNTGTLCGLAQIVC